MLTIELIRFDAADIITTSFPIVDSKPDAGTNKPGNEMTKPGVFPLGPKPGP